MKSLTVGPRRGWLVVVGLLAFVVASAWPLDVHALGKGVTIKINAQNKSITDTPFCEIGQGKKGDKLKVNVFTDLSGVTTGTAVFTDADHQTTTLHIDTVVTFFGGVLLEESSSGNVVAIWLTDDQAPAFVNVELPGGCGNTVSTFTVGVDTVGLQIKF